MQIVFRLKQAAFWVAYRVDQWLPMRLRLALRNRCMPWGRPVLDVVEMHIADHCNLNCAGCLHFTPFAKPWLADAETVAADVAALKRKFRFIRHITLLGGEPLLNPEYGKIVAAVRRASPESLVTVVTNGVTLNGVELKRFLGVCSEHGVRVKWTVYPPLRGRRRELVDAFRKAGVRMFMVEVGDFYVKMLPRGGDARKAMRECRKTTYCPYLRGGRLYTCAQAYHIGEYAEAYERETGAKTEMRAAAGLDVRDAALGGWRILEYLMTPCETCRFCSERPRFIKWAHSAKKPEEWIA